MTIRAVLGLARGIIARVIHGKNSLMNSKHADTAKLVWHPYSVTREQREKRNKHRGCIVWLTGLPGSGKSTIAHVTEKKLHDLGFQTVVLDGDNIRHGLCADLGFSVSDRNENIRRVGEVAKLFLETGTVVLVALVSPVRGARDSLRQSLSDDDFIEVYCNCPLAVCKKRDPKGMYAKAESGMIPEFTGVSSPYEVPLEPTLILDTSSEGPEESANRLTQFLLKHVISV